MLSEQQQRIMGYFIEEAKDHLNTIEQGLLNLQATIADPEMVSEVFRAAHSVKGGAAMLGLDSIQQTAHRLEDYFKLLKECPVKVDQKLETLSLRVFDTLQELLEQLQGPFGLTEDKASEVMANVEPVFTQLNQHLSDLVAQSGGVPPSDVELPQPVRVAPIAQPNREESALRLVFQSDVPSRLREMLQLFKQADTADSRLQLQEVCQTLVRMGEQFDIPAWGELLEMARQAVANPNNTYRTLAPVLIKNIKQGHELVLAGRSPEIIASSDLTALVPAPIDLTDTDFGDLLTISDLPDAADAPDLFDFPAFDALDLNETDNAEDDNWFTDAPASAQLDQLDFDSLEQQNPTTSEELSFDYPLSRASAHPSGPEVGIAELNSLADLFEQEVPDLDMTWQEEPLVYNLRHDRNDQALPGDKGEDNLFEPLDLDASDDFSDLLFDDASALPIEADDDISGLFNRSESIDALSQSVPPNAAAAASENLNDLLNSDFFDRADDSDDIDFSELAFTDAVPDPLSSRSNHSDDGTSTGSNSDLGNLDELFDSLEEDGVLGAIDPHTTSSEDLSSLFETDLNDSNELFSMDAPIEADSLEAMGTDRSETVDPAPLKSADDLVDLSSDWATPADETSNLPTDIPPSNAVDLQAANAAPWTTELNASIFDEVSESATNGAPVWDGQDVIADLWGETDNAEPASSGEMTEADFFAADPFTPATSPQSASESIESAPLSFDFTADLDDEGAEAIDLDNFFNLPSEDVQPLSQLEDRPETDLDWLMMETEEGSIDRPTDNVVSPTAQYSDNLRLFGSSEASAETLPAGAVEDELEVDLGDLFGEETETPDTDWSSSAEFQPAVDQVEANLGNLFGEELPDSDLLIVADLTVAELPAVNELRVDLGDSFGEEAPEADLPIITSQPAIDEPEADLGDLFGEELLEADLLIITSQPAIDEPEADLGDLFGEELPAADLLIVAGSSATDEPEFDLDDLFGADDTGFDSIDEFASQAEPEAIVELPDNAAEPDASIDAFADLFAEQGFFETAESIALSETATPVETVPDALLDLDDSDLQAVTDLDFLSDDPNAIEDPAADLDFSLDLSMPTSDAATTPDQPVDDLDELSWLTEGEPNNVEADALLDFAVRSGVTEQDRPSVAKSDADEDLSWLMEERVTAELSAADDLSNEAEFDAAMLDFDAIDLTNASAELDALDFGSSDADIAGSEEADFLDAPAAAPAQDDPGGLDALFSNDGFDEDAIDPASLQSPDDLDASLNLSPNQAPAADDLDDLDLWGKDETFAPPTSAQALPIGSDSDGFDDLDALLGEAESVAATDAIGSESDGFDDLDALLASVPAAETSASSAPVTAEDDFADLEALLDDEMPISSISGFNESDQEDFADLEALLGGGSAIVSSPPQDLGEFDDLEKLLEDADQTLGGPATNRGVRRPALTPKKRSPGVLNDQTMRVSVKNLDNLNNLVGELVVNRNSLEQTQERLRQFLDNLLYQVQQLSDVGQRMRDLYERSLLESSLLSSRRSYQLSGSGNGGAIPAQGNHSTGMSFDALEMDRFTGFHTLSQEMIELIVRVRESASDIDFVVDESDQVTRMFRQVTTQLQEGLTRSRMVSFDQTAARLPRAVRDISVKCGKQAELAIEGKETLIDKMILEQLYDPMTHLVNNAITHGIETPDERRAAGKPPMGRITIRAFHQGNQTVISVTDDGAGIDPEKVKRKAIEKRIISALEARSMTRLDVYDLLFQHGFSTRDKADDFAGRGVGMDVVRTSLNEIRGSVNIDSTVGRGTTFTIRLPLTLSISKALCCISNRARIAFPMDGVEDMLDVPKEQIQTDAEGRTCLQWRDSLLPFQPLSDLLKYSRSLGRGSVYGGNQEDDVVSVVVLRSNAGSFIALQVDQVLGEQEIVIKQLEGPVPKPIGVAGATVLGDGHIMPIADVLELIDLSFGRIRRETGSSLWEKEDQIPVEPQVTKTDPTVLIVDDSITVRELLSMTFNKIGYRVEQARDGQEAWEKLRAGLPCDLVFCDIEMPRMDGLELLSRIQKDPNLSHLPIAMLTSRGADRHRQMAVQLGAKGYFTKPYLEEALLDAAQRMLKGEVLVG